MLVYPAGDNIKEASLKKYWCIFLYKQGEDCNQITGQAPLIWGSEVERTEWVKSDGGIQDITSWTEKGLTIVFRTIDLVV